MTKTVGKSSGQDTEISRTLTTLLGRCLRERVWRRAGRSGKLEGVVGAVVTSLQDLFMPQIYALSFQNVAIALSYPQGNPLPWGAVSLTKVETKAWPLTPIWNNSVKGYHSFRVPVGLAEAPLD